MSRTAKAISIFQHLFQRRRLRTDGAVFAANKDQIIRDLGIVASAGQIASKDGKGGGAPLTCCQAGLDLDIKVTKVVRMRSEIKTLAPECRYAQGRAGWDGELLGLAQITVGGIDNAVRFIRINRVITEHEVWTENTGP